MLKATRDRMSGQILATAADRYGVEPAALHELDGFESFIFELDRDGEPFVLRLGHDSRRSVNAICGEVDWINWLAAGDVDVARALPSVRGNLVEVLPDGAGGHFLGTLFVRAAGGPVADRGGWNDALIDACGSLLGRLHQRTRGYVPGDPAWQRGAWHEPRHLEIEALLGSDPALLGEARELIRHLRTLPKPADAYGMIHQDVHAGNFFVDDDGRITLFDFDDCLYGHFVYDLAMVLFYVVTNRPDAAVFGADFWSRFKAAYLRETELDAAWFAEIPAFMRLRELDLYAAIQRDYDSLVGDEWVEQFLDGRRDRIMAREPYLAITL